jgi:hypothetical protein
MAQATDFSEILEGFERLKQFCNKAVALRRVGKFLIETATMSDYIAWHDNQIVGAMQEERPTIKEIVHVY